MLGRDKVKPHHSGKINKNDISNPINNSIAPIQEQQDPHNSINSAALQPFNELHFDASASVAGGPLDPRVQRAGLPPPKLSFMQIQALAQSIGAFRRQIQAMSAATETIVRCLEDLNEVVPYANIKKQKSIQDLDFLISATQLISNAHQQWAQSLENHVEIPMNNKILQIEDITKNQKIANEERIKILLNQLQVEEHNSYKMGKKKKRDLLSLQNSLNIRSQLAQEIQSLTESNNTKLDDLSHDSVQFLLDTTCGNSVATLNNTFDTINEGLKKIIDNVPDISRLIITTEAPKKPPRESSIPSSIKPTPITAGASITASSMQSTELDHLPMKKPIKPSPLSSKRSVPAKVLKNLTSLERAARENSEDAGFDGAIMRDVMKRMQ